MKFLKREPKHCSICESTEIYKSLRTKDGKFYYCKKCHTEFYDNLKPKITKYVENEAKNGRTIGMRETQELVSRLSKETNTEITQGSQ